MRDDDLADIDLGAFSFKGRELEALGEVLHKEVAFRHHLDLVVLNDADNRKLDVCDNHVFAVLHRHVEDTLSDQLLEFFYGGLAGGWKVQCDVDDGLDEAERVILERQGLVGLRLLARDGHTQHVVRVERDRDVVAHRAVHSRFELAVEELDEDGVVSLHEGVPELSGNDLVGAAIAVFHLDVGLLGDGVQVLVHRLQQDRKHLLRVVL